MKNITISIILIFVLGNLCHVGLPWWSLVPLAALVGWAYAQRAVGAFFAGFIAGFLLWYGGAWLADSGNGGMLSAKVGELFMGVQGSQLMLVAGLLGGFLAAFGAMTGKLGREMFGQPSKRGRNYLQERRRR